MLESKALGVKPKIEIRVSRFPDPMKPDKLLVLPTISYSNPAEEKRPLQVVFVLDRSGSMDAAIPNLKAATQQVIKGLNAERGDQVGLITFDDVIDAFGPALASDVKLHDKVAKLTSGGTTNIIGAFRAIDPKYIVDPNACLILFLTDGLHNVGPDLEPVALINEVITKFRSQKRILPPILPVGMADYDAKVMQTFCNLCTQPFYHVTKSTELVDTFKTIQQKYLRYKHFVRLRVQLQSDDEKQSVDIDKSGWDSILYNNGNPVGQVYPVSMSQLQKHSKISSTWDIDGEVCAFIQDFSALLKNPANIPYDPQVLQSYFVERFENVINDPVKSREEKMFDLIDLNAQILRVLSKCENSQLLQTLLQQIEGVVQEMLNKEQRIDKSILAFASQMRNAAVQNQPAAPGAVALPGADQKGVLAPAEQKVDYLYRAKSLELSIKAKDKTCTTYAIVTSETNFAAEDFLTKPFLFLDYSPGSPEYITVNPQNVEEREAFVVRYKKALEDCTVVGSGAHQYAAEGPYAIADFVAEQLHASQLDDLVKGRMDVPLFEYMLAGRGIARQQVIYAAMFAGEAIRKKLLPAGAVHVYWGLADKGTRHPCVLYATQDPQGKSCCYLMDPSNAPDNRVFELTTEIPQAKAYYAGRNLAGVLDQLRLDLFLSDPSLPADTRPAPAVESAPVAGLISTFASWMAPVPVATPAPPVGGANAAGAAATPPSKHGPAPAKGSIN